MNRIVKFGYFYLNIAISIARGVQQCRKVRIFNICGVCLRFVGFLFGARNFSRRFLADQPLSRLKTVSKSES